MAQEIELKLSIPLEYKEKLSKHPLLARHLNKAVKQQQLFNRYFDTPAGDLNQHRIALRIRQADDLGKVGAEYIQTLKTRGTSQGGLHSRNEWEWPLTQPELDFSLLPADALPDGLDFSALTALFDTDFQRTTWQLNYNNTELELVLDLGQVSLPQDPSRYCDTLHEIELELLSGEPLALFDLALELAQDIPLRITQISKAERGYRLLRQAGTGFGTERPTNSADSLGAVLECCQADIEALVFKPTETAQDKVLQSLQRLKRHLNSEQQSVLAQIEEHIVTQSGECAAPFYEPLFYEQRFCQMLLQLARTSYLNDK